MSAREPTDRDGTTGHDENFLSRWSRRKAQSRAVEPAAADAAPGALGPASMPPVNAPAAQPSPEQALEAAGQAPAIELPDLNLLGHDSDYSAFLAPGVDADLRKRALRQLFASPKFNVFDGLDTYRDDYTSFPALGSVVTADMRYHVERLARKVAEVLDDQTSPATHAGSAAPAAAVAAEVAVPETESSTDSGAPAAEPPTPTPMPEENHDRSA